MRIFDKKGLREALSGLEAKASSPAEKRKILSYGAHRFWLAAATIVTVASSILHIAAFFVGSNILGLSMIPLALFALAIFARMMIASGFGRKSRELASRGDILGGLESSLEEMSTVLKKTPMIAKVGVLLVGLYCGVNFYSFVRLAIQGSPVERDGRYWLEDHGRAVRALDDIEFRHREMWEVRGLSGHLVGFSLVAAVGFRYLVDHRPKDAS
jgi:hypothetical protein